MTSKTPPQSKPWYRYRGPWLLMAGPAIAVIAGIGTIIIANRNADDLVADDYYKRGKAIDMDLRRNQTASRLGLGAHIILGTDGRTLRVQIQGKAGYRQPEQLTLRLHHPIHANLDQSILLEQQPGHYYQGQSSQILSGRWHVSLDDSSVGWRLNGTWQMNRHTSIELHATALATDKQNHTQPGQPEASPN